MSIQQNNFYAKQDPPYPNSNSTNYVGADGVQVVHATPLNPNDPSANTMPEGKVLLIEADLPTRHKFIQKVYGILTLQLLITFGFVAFFSFFEPASEFLQENVGVFYGVMAVSFAIIIVLVCCVSVARKHPWGLILLFVFTLCESTMIGFLASFFAVQDVFIAVGITTVIVLGLSLFACQTKYDFTGCAPFIFVLLLVLICFGIVLIFVAESREVQILYSVLGVLVFSFYLVFDTQLVVGGAHRKFAFTIDDYVFAALNLYLDIINLLLYVLILVGGGNN